MLQDRIQTMLPEGIGLALRDIAAPCEPLWPPEDRAVVRAVPARQREFAAGRAAARAAMIAAGLPPAALPAGPDRAPRWPEGVAGSISHAGMLAGAIAAPGQHVPAMGLDLERALPLPADLADLVLTPGDGGGSGLDGPLSAMLLFSAKEAAFKAQFPLTGLWTDYREVAVRLTPTGFSLSVLGTPLQGRWCRAQGMFACVLTITPAQRQQIARNRPLR